MKSKGKMLNLLGSLKSQINEAEYENNEPEITGLRPGDDLYDSIYRNILDLVDGECSVSECVNAIAEETGIESDAKSRIKRHIEEETKDFPLSKKIHYEIKVMVDRLVWLAIKEQPDNSDLDEEWIEI